MKVRVYRAELQASRIRWRALILYKMYGLPLTPNFILELMRQERP